MVGTNNVQDRHRIFVRPAKQSDKVAWLKYFSSLAIPHEKQCQNLPKATLKNFLGSTLAKCTFVNVTSDFPDHAALSALIAYLLHFIQLAYLDLDPHH